MSINFESKIISMVTEPLVKGKIEFIEQLNLKNAESEDDVTVDNVFIKLENGNYLYLNGYIDKILVVTPEAIQANLTNQETEQITKATKLKTALDKFK